MRNEISMGDFGAHQAQIADRFRSEVNCLKTELRALTAERDALAEKLATSEDWYRVASEQRDAAVLDMHRTFAERDALLADRDAWRTRCLGTTPTEQETTR